MRSNAFNRCLVIGATLLVGAAAAAQEAAGMHVRRPPAVDVGALKSLGLPVATLPRGVTSFGACVTDEGVFLAGGYFGVPHHYLPEHQSGAFLRLDAATGAIKDLPGIEPMQSVALVPHRGRLLLVGGMLVREGDGDDPASPRVTSSTTFRAFDLAVGRWTDLPALPEPRSSHDAVLSGDRLVVVGGWNLAGDPKGATWHGDALVLDLAAAEPGWHAVQQPFKRRAVGAAALGDLVVVAGGIDASGETSSRVDVLDLAAGSWSRAPDLPSDGFGVACCAADGRVFASTGDGKVHAWRPGDAQWTPVATLTFPRFFHRLVALSDVELLALGGYSEDFRPVHVESIRLDQDVRSEEPSRRVARWTLPHPGASKNRQGIVLHGESLFVFGGNDSVEQHDFEPENFLDEGWRVNLATLSVDPIASFPAKRQTMQAALAWKGRKAYAVGGFGHDGEVARTHPETFVYTFESGTWEDAGAPLPVARSQFGLAEHDGTLWIFGGLDYDPRRGSDDSFRHLTSILSWRPGDPAGFVEANVVMESERRAFASAVCDGRYYVVGGMRSDFETVADCTAFEFATQSWRPIAAPARPRINGQLVALDGVLFLAGGSSPGDSGIAPNPTLEAYDPASDRWTTLLDEIPVPAAHGRMFAFRGQLLFFSTQDADEDVIRLALVRPWAGLRPNG